MGGNCRPSHNQSAVLSRSKENRMAGDLPETPKERWQRVVQIFGGVKDLSAGHRTSYLEAACQGDSKLRREVEDLLAEDATDENFLNPIRSMPAPDVESMLEGATKANALINSAAMPEAVPQFGVQIDRYHLLQKVGEGGMGEVWLAEQIEPVRRNVALKVVKAGMNTREVIARFESERQALALMDHPAIAKVFDAGSTPQGLPYFVMEYVSGVRITAYCDDHRLTIRQRLELFMHVCEGVQHAHQKAIIHRDLKPSNILVTEVDGRPAPKII